MFNISKNVETFSFIYGGGGGTPADAGAWGRRRGHVRTQGDAHGHGCGWARTAATGCKTTTNAWQPPDVGGGG